MTRQNQVAFYARCAGGPVDPDGERAIRGAVIEAEEWANSPWDARLEGARLAITEARQAVAEFARGHWDELAAELPPLSAQAQTRLAAALDETDLALVEYANVIAEWQQVLPLAGVPVNELPGLDLAAVQAALPGDVPVPAPVSLLNTNGKGPA